MDQQLAPSAGLKWWEVARAVALEARSDVQQDVHIRNEVETLNDRDRTERARRRPGT
jgi:hypothetical protein